MKKVKLTDKEFYQEHENVYNVLTDYINDNLNQVPISGTNPHALIDVMLFDCYFNEAGDLFVPVSYNWTYKGSNDTDDQDEYEPEYNETPTLTRLQIANLVAFAEEPEFNDKARNI